MNDAGNGPGALRGRFLREPTTSLRYSASRPSKFAMVRICTVLKGGDALFATSRYKIPYSRTPDGSLELSFRGQKIALVLIDIPSLSDSSW